MRGQYCGLIRGVDCGRSSAVREVRPGFLLRRSRPSGKGRGWTICRRRRGSVLMLVGRRCAWVEGGRDRSASLRGSWPIDMRLVLQGLARSRGRGDRGSGMRRSKWALLWRAWLWMARLWLARLGLCGIWRALRRMTWTGHTEWSRSTCWSGGCSSLRTRERSGASRSGWLLSGPWPGGSGSGTGADTGGGRALLTRRMATGVLGRSSLRRPARGVGRCVGLEWGTRLVGVGGLALRAAGGVERLELSTRRALRLRLRLSMPLEWLLTLLGNGCRGGRGGKPGSVQGDELLGLAMGRLGLLGLRWCVLGLLELLSLRGG